MANYKKSKEHLTYAAMASPISFLMGGPTGLVSTLALGKLMDVLDDIDYERRQEEWKNNPHRWEQPTLDEINAKTEEDYDYKEKINNLPQIKNGIEIRGCSNYKKGHENDVYITVFGGRPLQFTKTGIGDGEVVFHKGNRDCLGYKRVKAKLFYNEKDFYESFQRDYKWHPNMKIYKVIASSYKDGHWMYTMDNGSSYVVGL